MLAKERAGEPLTAADRKVHDAALVTTLRSLHDDLDRAVAEAYGWPSDLMEEEVLRRLLELNRERSREERDGLVRWLRPDFQNPERTEQAALVTVAETVAEEAPAERSAWPGTLAGRARAVAGALARLGAPASAEEVARSFRGRVGTRWRRFWRRWRSWDRFVGSKGRTRPRGLVNRSLGRWGFGSLGLWVFGGGAEEYHHGLHGDVRDPL